MLVVLLFVYLFIIHSLNGEVQLQPNSTITIEDNSIETLCHIFNISLSDCSCNNYPDLCHNEQPNVVHYCSREHDIGMAVVMTTIAVIGLTGNMAVLAVTYINWCRIGNYRKFVGYLAVSDFLFSIFTLIFHIPSFWTCKWVYGAVLCKIISPGIHVTSLVAIGIIVLISLDRYYTVLKPFKQNVVSFNMLNAFNAIVALIFVAPSAAVIEYNTVYQTCAENWGDNHEGSLIYSWFLLFATYMVPFVVVTYMYSRVLKFLYSQHVDDQALNQTQKQTKSKLQANKEIMKIFLAIIVAYFFLVLPNSLVWVLIEHLNNMSFNTLHALKYFALIPYLLHAAINPCIYSVLDRSFRKNLTELMVRNDTSKRRRVSQTSVSSLSCTNRPIYTGV